MKLELVSPHYSLQN